MPYGLKHSPAQILAKHLVAMGLGTTPTTDSSWPINYDNEPGRPDAVITVYDTPGSLFRNDPFGQRNEHNGIQIKIRAGTHSVGYEKADAIATALDNWTNVVTVLIDTSIYCLAMVRRTSPVIRMGPEGNTTRRGYTVNALVYVRKVN